MTSPLTGIIWDVDGTLVDTAELHFDAWVRMAAEMGRPFSREDFSATFGRRNPEIVSYLFQTPFNDEEIARIGETKERYYRAEAEKGLKLLPGVADYLRQYQSAGLQQAVGSSAPRGNLDLILRITEIGRYFGAVVGMEDTSRGKPDPEVFLTAARRLGKQPHECIVFEDAVAGVQAAKSAGMACVGITFVGHHSAEKLRAAGADRVVRTLEEVPPIELLRQLCSP